MKYLSAFLLPLLLLSLHAAGQSFKEFSGQGEYLTELEEQLVNRAVGDAKKDQKELMDKFTEMWTELNSFTPDQKRTIFTTCNKILDERLKVIPDIRDYIITVIAVVGKRFWSSAL